MGRDLADELMGKVDAHRARVPARAAADALAGGDAAARRRARLARRPRAHPDRPRRAAHPHRRAGVAPGRGRGRASGRGSVFLGVVEDTVRFLDDRPATTCEGARGAGDRGRPARPRARPSGPQGRGPAHAADLRDRRGDGPARARICAAARGCRASHARADRPRAAHQRRRRGGRRAGRLGFPAALLRGFALLARTAGLLGHLAEEMQSPIGMRLYREVDERAKYAPPTGE